jgi:hypothetical protein
MKRQVFVIHGGHARDSYEDYIEHLKKKEVTLDELRRMDWKKFLGQNLGEAYDVYTPLMPCKENAKYAEWKIWFEKFVPFFEDGIFFVGHSLEGIFLAKYLAENDFPKRIAGTFLVAAPLNTPTQHPRADFNILGSLAKFEAQGGEIFLYHSKDDAVVPFSNFERYTKELSKAHAKALDGRGHFNDEDFPEIVEDIRTLA